MVDKETLKLADVDIEFISTNAGMKNKMLDPERQIVRYELLEILVRVGIQKFHKGPARLKLPNLSISEV